MPSDFQRGRADEIRIRLFDGRNFRERAVRNELPDFKRAFLKSSGVEQARAVIRIQLTQRGV